MRLFNKITFKGELREFTLKRTQGGTDFGIGLVHAYDTDKNGKQSNFINMPFVIFDDGAVKLSKLPKNTIVMFEGKMKENNFNNQRTLQMFVDSIDLTEMQNTYHVEQKQEEKQNRSYQPRHDDDDDNPF